METLSSRRNRRVDPASSRRWAGRLLGKVVAAGLLLAGATMAGASQPAAAAPAAADLRPIIFVHGAAGSGSQFDTQARRFASNGYPADYIETEDYNSLGLNQDQVWADLDAKIARLKAKTGKDKVELLGHSLGTAVSQGYLKSSAARAANVAHYVNLDGTGATALPGGVPTLNITGEGNTATITGATNVAQSTQSHVQVTSSAETFAAAYRFFTGSAPATTNVVAQSGTIQLGGRALSFPDNAGLTNYTLAVYPVDPATGQRTSQTPVATPTLASDGSFGPFDGSGTLSYEFALTHTPTGMVHHQYFQPFLRTDLIIHLLGTYPSSGIDLLLERDAAHVTALVYRNKEFWGDQGTAGDTLVVNSTSILNAQNTPKGKRACGLFLYDSWKNKQTDLNNTPLGLNVLPFVSSADVYLPASPTASGTVTFQSTQRGGNGHVDQVAVPNWPSDKNTVTVYLNDYVNS